MNANKLTEHLTEMNNLDGTFISQSGLWKLKSKLCPKSQDPSITQERLWW